jgi:signal transduction histidine kinase/CheY-like chemotaxis protein
MSQTTSPPSAPRPTKILIVDDRPEGLLTLRAVLSCPDYELVEASSGLEALRLLLNDDFAAVLLDVQMPGMDGFETAALIKQRERCRETPIIFITAISREDRFIFKGYESGAVDYLVKPFDPHTLQAKVSVFVELYRKNQMIHKQAEKLREIERQAEREKLEQIESANTLRYRTLADAIPQILWKSNPEGSLDYVNRIWTRFSGLAPEHSHGDGWQVSIHANDLEALLASWREARDFSTPFEVECRIREEATSRYAWHLIKGVPEWGTDGSLSGWILSGTHIDDRKHEEQRQRFLANAGAALAESLDYEETLRNVTRLAVPALGQWCILHVVQADGSLEMAAVEALDPVKAREFREHALRYPEQPDATQGPRHVARSGRSELIQELTTETFSTMARSPEHAAYLGTLGFRSQISVPLIARKRILGVLTVISTDRSFGERDAQLLEELGTRAALAVMNATLYEDAQRAIRSRDEFLSIASHELKTPLTPLKIQTQTFRLMADRGHLVSPSPQKLFKMLETSDRQVEKLASLIEEMLDISRINIGRLELTLEQFNLRELIDDSVERFNDELRISGCSIVVEAPAELPVCWDRFRMEQVLVNLITNSIKYAPEKPILIRASVTPDSTIRFSIRDEGIGIDKKDQPRIFERFERAVSAKHFGGLGLGLYIVRQILIAHSGSIRVESEPGHGCEFHVELPASVRSREEHASGNDVFHQAPSFAEPA